MTGDIIIIIACLSLILFFRQIDKPNRSFEKVKKYSDKVLADFDEYFKKQGMQAKNAGIDLDVKQSQAVAAVNRLEQNIVAIESRSVAFSQKIAIVDDIEKRLSAYETSIKDLFEMTERVEENLEKIRNHSGLVNKVSRQLDEQQNRLAGIEKCLPTIISEFEKQNNEKMTTLGSEFSFWVDQRANDLQTLADSAVDKNEALLDEIQQVYDQSLSLAVQKADNFEGEIFEKLKDQTRERSEEFENILSRNTQDLFESVEREKTEIEQTITAKIDEARFLVDDSRSHFQSEADFALAEVKEMLISSISEQKITISSELKDQQDIVNTMLNETSRLVSSVSSEQDDKLAFAIAQQNEKLKTTVEQQNEMLETTVEQQNEKLKTTLTQQNEMLETTVSKQTENLATILAEHEQHTTAELALQQESVRSAREETDRLLTVMMEEQSQKLSAAIEHQQEYVTTELTALAKEIAHQAEELSVFDATFSRTEDMIKHMDETVLTKQQESQELLERLDSNSADLLKAFDEKTNSLERELENTLSQLQKNILDNSEKLSRDMHSKYDDITTNLNSHLLEMENLFISDRDAALQNNQDRAIVFFEAVDNRIDDAKRDMEYRFERLDGIGKDVDALEDNFRRLVEGAEKHLLGEVGNFRTQFQNEADSALCDVKGMLISSIAEQKEKIFSDLTEQQDEINTVIAKTEDLLSVVSSNQDERLATILSQQNENLETILAQQNEVLETTVAQQNAALETAIDHQNVKLETTINQQNELLETTIDHQNEMLETTIDQQNEKLETAINHQNEKLGTTIGQQNEKLEITTAQQTNNLSAILDEHEQSTAAELASRQELLRSNCDETTRLLNVMSEEQEQKLTASIEYQKEHLQSTLSQYKEQLKASIERQQEYFDTELTSLAEKTASEIARQAEELSVFDTNFSRTEEMVKHMDKAVLAKQQESQELLERLQHYLDSNSGNLLKVVDEKTSSIEQELGKSISLLRKNIIDNSESLSETMNTRYDEIKSNFESRLLEMDNFLVSGQDEVIKNNKDRTTIFFDEIDNRINNTKKDMEYRFERLNVVCKDIDTLESNFRRLMETAEQRLLGEFEAFRGDRTTAQTDFEKEITGSFNTMKEGLETLDAELNNLKTRAYDNVSEKLQLFEDDFFDDLNNRSETLSASLMTWKEGFDTHLVGIGNHLEDNRLSMEAKHSDEMKEHFGVIQGKYHEQLARLEENIKSSEYNFADRMGGMETTLRSFIDLQRTEIDTAKQSAEEYLKSELENQGQIAIEQLKRYERDISVQLNQLAQSVAVNQEETSGSLESVLGELTSWRERLNTQFEENHTLYSDKLRALQQTSSDQIAQVQQIFNSELGDYVTLAKDEREHLSMELDELKMQSKNSLETYEQRTSEMLEEFKKEYEIMLDDTQRKIRSGNSDAEQKLRTLKAMVQEVREKNEDTQEKMVLKIQKEANLLTMSMDDIDKRLKQFVAQTPLFEKVDEMKNTLENQMGDLRTHMTRFENFKQITDSIEVQFTKIRKMDDDVASKLQRFSAEKNRVDTLETDFNKLIGLSSSMDKKIADLQNTSDDLQVLQVEVRRFQDTLGDISTRYDRLEKKNTVLEQTMDGVDKTFDGLRELEERLAACAQQTMEMPDAVNNLKIDLKNLMESSQSIGDVMDRLSNLDSILAETSQQVEDVQKAREWIVRTEERLGEMTKEAKEQVNLFGALMKSGTSPKNNAGAPPIAVRENIIKLAHQGWKPEQISASLNVTIGEVELVLDFYGKEGR